MQIVARRLLFDSSHTAQRGPGVEGSTLRVSDSDFPYDLSGSSQLGKRLMPIEIDKAVKEAVDAGAASVFGKEALPSREEVGRHCQHLLVARRDVLRQPSRSIRSCLLLVAVVLSASGASRSRRGSTRQRTSCA